MKVFDVPVLPDEVAVTESVPVAVSVTDWLDKTPETNDEVVVGVMPVNRLDKVAVPVNDVAVLLLASWATILMLKATPDVCDPIEEPEMLVITKWSSAPGLTVKVFDVPVFVPPWSVAVIVSPAPAAVTVNDSVRTPPIKLVDVVGEIDPAVVDISAVPV